MADLFTVNASPRQEEGKGASRRLRRQNKVPGIIYGAGKPSTSISVTHKELAKSTENEAFFSRILTINLEGQSKPERVVIKDMMRHVFKPQILHVDFQRINEAEKLTMKIPLHFLGEDKCPGVTLEGGILTKQMNEIEVSCLPADLPEYIGIDVSSLHLNDGLHLSQLVWPKGVECVALAHGDDRAVVSIHEVKEEVEEVVAPVAAEVPASAQKSPEELATEAAAAGKGGAAGKPAAKGGKEEKK